MATVLAASVLPPAPAPGYPSRMRLHSTFARSSLLLGLSFGVALSLLSGCPMDGHDDDHTGEDGSLASYSIHGVVSRTEAAVPTDDGVGTLFIAVLSDCTLDATMLGGTGVPNADLSIAGATVPFELPDLPPGELHLALFLDDDLSADPMMPLPSPGDLVYADVVGDGVLSCVAVSVDDEDVEGLALVLNGVVPGAPG